MPSDADIRSVLREHGIPVTPRGKLGAKHHAEYERITGKPAGDSAEGDTWTGPDDEGDVIMAHIPGPAAGELEDQDDDDGAEPVTETRPRRVHASRGKAAHRWADRIRGKAPGTGKPKAKPRPRLPVDRLISRGWKTGARIIAPVSQATARTLMLQAPVAGLVLEDKVKNTAADTVLQYGARLQEAGETAFALAGPPLIVAAIEKAQGLPEPQRQLRLAVLLPMLEEALTMWVKIAGDKVTEAAEQMAADAATSAEVERLIALIFPQATVEPEEAPADTMAA